MKIPRRIKAMLAIAFLASLGGASLEGASILVLIRAVSSWNGSAAGLRGVGVLVIALVGARCLLTLVHAEASSRAQVEFISELRLRLASRVLGSTAADLAVPAPGALMNRFVAQVEAYVAAVRARIDLANAGFLVLAYVATLVSLSWRLVVPLVPAGIAFVALAVFCGKRVRVFAGRLLSLEESQSQVFASDLASLPAIRAYGLKNERLAKYSSLAGEFQREFITLHRWRSASRIGAELLAGGAVLVVAWLTSRSPSASPGTVGAVMGAFVFALYRLQGCLAGAGSAIFDITEGRECSAGLRRALASAPDEGERVAAPIRPRELSVRRLRFSYPGSERGNAINEVDLRLSAGELTVLQGPSGAGKTTLCHLVAGLLEPTGGDVALDGVSLKEISRASLSRSRAIVFEESLLFDESIEWNIRCGRPISSDAAIRAARAAGVDDFVKSLPAGYETRIGFRGNGLSAGQRQRLAIARALAGAPDILILEDATSALDAGTEARVLEGIRRELPGAIVLLVTHRVAPLEYADHVLLLSGGKLRCAEMLDTKPSLNTGSESPLKPRSTSKSEGISGSVAAPESITPFAGNSSATSSELPAGR